MKKRKSIFKSAALLTGLSLMLILLTRSTTSAQTVTAVIPTTLSAQSVAVDAARNRIFVGQDDSFGREGFEVAVIDGATNAIVKTIPISGIMGQYGIAVNGVSGRVYVTNGFGLIVIDADSLSILSTIGIPSFGSTVVAVNPITNRIYVNFASSGLAVIDGNSGSVLATMFLSLRPTDLEVDPVRNRIYATHGGAGFFSVIDGTSNSLLPTVPISGSISAMAVDTSLGQLYFAQDTTSPPASLFILDSSTHAILATLTIGLRCGGVGVDTSTHRVYTGSEDNPSLRGVTVIDGVTRQVTTFVSTGGIPAGRPVEVNSITHRVYVPSGAPEPNSQVIVIQDAPPNADLAVTKTASPNPVVTGSSITYTITVTNGGPGAAENVTVTDNLPAEISFVSCSSTGGVCGGSGNNRTVTFASLAAGASETITIVAIVNCLVSDNTAINNMVTISSSTPDPNTSNNSSSGATTASNPPPTITSGPINATYQCIDQVPPANPSDVTATDNCGTPTVTVSHSSNGGAGSPGSPLIITRTFTVTDGIGGNSSATQTIMVIDNTPPVFTNVPSTVTATTGPGATDCGVVISDATLGTATANDNCSGTVIITRSGIPAGNLFPVGTTTITHTATDAHGNTAIATQSVTVIENTPPSITSASVRPSVLWPSNHEMVDVIVSYAASDNCGSVSCSLSVTSNEPVNGTGDGDTAPDWEIVDAHHVRIRAERAGSGNGRVYTITITCTDGSGNTTSESVTVTVPHNR